VLLVGGLAQFFGGALLGRDRTTARFVGALHRHLFPPSHIRLGRRMVRCRIRSRAAGRPHLGWTGATERAAAAQRVPATTRDSSPDINPTRPGRPREPAEYGTGHGAHAEPELLARALPDGDLSKRGPAKLRSSPCGRQSGCHGARAGVA
jgi:hypothetical protein